MLDLLIDLVQQAAHTTQGKIAEGAGNGEQLDECKFVQLQAKGVFGGEMFGTGRTLPQQRSEGETLAGGDFESGFGAALG